MAKLHLISIGLFLAACAPIHHKGSEWGAFHGPVVTEWLQPDRDMRLMFDVSYYDPEGVEWKAPKGSIINGASIPRAFWTVLGGPYEGAYRDASVIHDVACRERTRPWQAVHYAFYTAMRLKNVDEEKAKIMYAAVYRFGPRWGEETPTARTLTKPPTQQDVLEIMHYVQTAHPTLQDLETNPELPGRAAY